MAKKKSKKKVTKKTAKKKPAKIDPSVHKEWLAKVKEGYQGRGTVNNSPHTRRILSMC